MKEPQRPSSPCSSCGRRDGWTRHPGKHRGGWWCQCREVPPADVLALMIGSTMPETEPPAARP